MTSMDKSMKAAAGIYPQMADLKEKWQQKNPLIPVPNLLLIEYDPDTNTRKIKLTDGKSKYNELPYLLGGNLSEEFLTFLALHGQPGGVVVLGEDGIIDTSLLPKRLYGTLSIVSTYEDLIAGGEDPDTGDQFRSGPVIVKDATGDPSGSVQEGGAYYSHIDGAWVKMAEFREPDISLEDYFKYNGDDKLTLGSIADDTDDSEGSTSTDKYSKVSNYLLRSLEALTASDIVLYTHDIVVEQLDSVTLGEFTSG